MGKRIMVAVIFIPLLLVLFYLISPAYPWALCLLIAGLSMIAVHEVLWSTGFLKHTRISGYSIILAGLIPFWVYYDGRPLPALCGLFVYVVLLFAESIASHKRLSLEKLGVIFQDFRLIEKKTVRENLTFAMRAVGASPREIRKRVPYVLELVGLDQKGDRKPNQLSGGEQQRVAIARALVNNPQMIIADEPTGNLDPMRSLEIMMLLERINELGTTVLVVTHAKELVNRFSKRVVAIENGRIISDETGGYYNNETTI